MKVILSAVEFGRLSDVSNNVSLAINEIDSDSIVAPPLIEMLKENENKIISINVLPSGDVEFEYSEEYCLDTFALVEKHTIKLLPIFHKLEPVMEKFADAYYSLMRLFDKGLLADMKGWFNEFVEDAQSTFGKYI